MLGALSLPLISQSIIQKHYTHLENDPNATVVFVSGNLFGYASKFVQEENQEAESVKNMLEKINAFNLISVPDLSDPVSEYNKGITTLRSDDELVAVRDKTTRFSLFIQEKDGIISELAGIGALDSTFLVFSLSGEFDLSEISKLTEMLQENKNLDILEGASKEVVSDLKLYPNPVAIGQPLHLEIPQSMVGGQISVSDMNGKIVHQKDASEFHTELNLQGISSGNYILDFTKDDMNIKKHFIVIE